MSGARLKSRHIGIASLVLLLLIGATATYSRLFLLPENSSLPKNENAATRRNAEKANRESLSDGKSNSGLEWEPSGNQSQTPPSDSKDPPVLPPPKAKILSDAKPVLNWSLSKADYERISRDPNSTKEEREEAAARLILDFYRWPGREVQRLGGFLFEQADYRELDGFVPPEGGSRPRINIHLDGNQPVPCLEAFIALDKGGACLDLTVRVMASRDWAQRYFLAWVAGGARMAPFTGKLGADNGILIGDVCEGDAKDELQESAYVQFVRHNVAVRLNLHPSHREPVGDARLNVVALAQKIDRQVIRQSHEAAKWEDLTGFRPVIEEFSFGADELLQQLGKSQAPVTWSARHPLDKKINLFTQGESGKIMIFPVDNPKKVGIGLTGNYEERPYKTWLVAYDDALLFTVAEASVKVKPKSK